MLVHHFTHNKNRELLDACIDLIICRGFYCSDYTPGDYTGVVCRRPEPCCSKAKLFIEFLHFFRKFHKRSSVFSVRKRDLVVLHPVLLLSRDIPHEQILEFHETSAEEIALILEFQQIRSIDEAVIISKGFNMEKLGDLEYFRQALEFRESHGITRDPRPVKCFQSEEDIEAILEQLRLQNPVEFLVQSYALGMIDNQRLRTMYHTARDYDQLVQLLDRTADIRALYEDQFANREHSRMFIIAFSRIRRLTPSWHQAMLLFLLGINVPEGWHLPRTNLDTVPVECVDLYLNYFLVYCHKCLTKPGANIDDLEMTNNLLKIPQVVDKMVERGASLTFTAHSHDAARKELYRYSPSILLGSKAYVEQPCPMFSSIGTLMRLAEKRRELEFGDWLSRLCCSVKRDAPKIRFDDTRLPSLQCLAARAYDLGKEIENLPFRLRHPLLLHHDLKEIVRPRSPEGPGNE